MKPLTIGEVARQAGVGIQTVRFYERQGLLEEPERRASGYRQYDLEAIAVLKFIRRAKELGFTLKEIKSLLALRLDASATRAEVREGCRHRSQDRRPPTNAGCFGKTRQEVPRRRDRYRLPDP